AIARRNPDVSEAQGNVTSVFTLLDQAGKASTSASARLNVAGESRAAARLSDSSNVAGRDARSGSEVTLQKSWADANGIDLGDRVRLAAPVGVRSLRVVGLFQFTTGLDFGGQGFGRMPLPTG